MLGASVKGGELVLENQYKKLEMHFEARRLYWPGKSQPKDQRIKP